ncbi:MAG: transglutaminase, partial [Hyphomonas sp.]
MTDPLLVPTKLLDFDAAPLAHLIENRSWRG